MLVHTSLGDDQFKFMKNAFLYFILGATCMFASISLAQTSVGIIDTLTQEEKIQLKAEEYATEISKIATPEQTIELQEEYRNHQETLKILKEQNEWLIRIYEKISN